MAPLDAIRWSCVYCRTRHHRPNAPLYTSPQLRHQRRGCERCRLPSMRPTLLGMLRFCRLQVGLFCFALAITLMLGANIGLDPWSALQLEISEASGLSFGRITQLIGLALVSLSWLWLGTRPGWGTIFNMLLIGPWIDLIRSWAFIRTSEGGVWGAGQFVAGMLVMGFATALYIGANYGAGPRDGFVLGLARRLGTSIRATRIGIELTVLACAWLSGGAIGLGTLLFAVGMGPIMQAAFALLRVEAHASPRATSPRDANSGGQVPAPS